MTKIISKKESPNKKGFTLDHSLNNEELTIFRNAIHDQWLYRIQIENPQLASEIIKKDISITSYHKISNKLNHSSVWNKTSRILSPSFYYWFKESNFAKNLAKEYGEYSISDEDDLGWPNIYWRLVRPKANSDVGPIHRDAWFWTLNKNFPKPNYDFYRLKVWIPIYVEKGLNGLLVEPFSQLRDDIKWSGEERHSINKPVLKTPLKEINTSLVKTTAGQAIVFNDELLHGGALNSGDFCRVSVEFTLIIKA